MRNKTKKKKLKKCLILYVNDIIGALGKGPDEEFTEFKKDLKMHLEIEDVSKQDIKRLTFMNENSIKPSRSFDIMVLDYGGAASYGQSELAQFHVSTFVKLLEDYPSRYFVLVGWGLQHALQAEVQNTFGIDPKQVGHLYVSDLGCDMERVVSAVKDWIKFDG